MVRNTSVNEMLATSAGALHYDEGTVAGSDGGVQIRGILASVREIIVRKANSVWNCFLWVCYER